MVLQSDAWRQYRDRNTNRALLARLIRATYSDLFATFPDAQSKTETELSNFMSTKTGSPAGTVQFMVKTFTTLCVLADFDEEDLEEQPSTLADEGGTSHGAGASHMVRRTAQQMGTIALSGLQVNLHLPASDNPAVYEAIFRSFSRYVMGRKDDEADTTNVKPDETK